MSVVIVEISPLYHGTDELRTKLSELRGIGWNLVWRVSKNGSANRS
jgi:hypothetical protein